ncbi:MAG: hypothetical protein ACLFQV_00010 [Vulcanimicrobiota bacterium]
MLGSSNMSGLISVNPVIQKPLKLADTFYNREDNKEKIKEYFFTNTAKEVISDIYESVKNRKSSSILLTGRPGFGKSQTALSVINMLAYPSKYPVIELLDKNAPDIPIKKMKESMGRFMVVIPDVSEDMNQTIKEAVKKTLDVNNIIKINPEEYENSIALIEKLSEYIEESKDWNGLIIVLDDAEDLLRSIEDGQVKEKYKEIKDILEYIKLESSSLLYLLTVGSMFPGDYISPTVEDVARNKLKQEFDKFIWSSYEIEEWIEFLTKKIIHHSSMDTLNLMTTNSEFLKISQYAMETKVFKERNKDTLINEILLKSFPLHPFTMIFLPLLSEKVCNKDKNLLSFFKDNSPGSFLYYLDTFGIYQASGKLSVYTPDFLFSYYEQVIKEADNMAHVFEAVEKAYMVSGNIPLARRIIRLVATMQIINHPDFRPFKRNIIENLYMAAKDEKKFDPVLINMVQKKSFVFDSKNQEIKLPIKKSSVKLEDYLPKQLEKISKQLSVADILNQYYRLNPVYATEYNKERNSTRKILRRYITIEDLRNERFPHELARKLGADKQHYKGDGAVLVLISDRDTDLMEARQLLATSPWKDFTNIIVAIPVRPATFVSLLTEKKALNMLKNEPPFSVAGSDEEELVKSRLEEINREIDERIEFYNRPDRLYWFYLGNNVTAMREKSINDLADALMIENFPYTPIVSHEAVASIQDRKVYREIRRKAINKIIISSDRILLHREKKEPVDMLIKAVFVDEGLLTRIRAGDNFEEYSVEGLSNKKTHLAATWNTLMSRMIQCSKSERLLLIFNEMVKDLLQPPIGITRGLLQVLIAAIFAHFDKQIQIFENFKEMQLTGKRSSLKKAAIDYDTIKKMVEEPKDYIIRFIKTFEEEQAFIEQVIVLFGGVTDPDKPVRWKDARNTLVEWFDTLPPVTVLNENFKEKNIGNFINWVNGNRDESPDVFFQVKLPAYFGFDVNEFSISQFSDRVINIFRDVRDYLVRYTEFRQATLWKAVKSIFTGKADTFEEKFSEWRKSLPKLNREKISQDARFLLEVEPGQELEKQFIDLLPEKMGLGPMDKWLKDNTLEFIARLSRAKLELSMNDLIEAFCYSRPETSSREDAAAQIIRNAFQALDIREKEQKAFIVSYYKEKEWEKLSSKAKTTKRKRVIPEEFKTYAAAQETVEPVAANEPETEELVLKPEPEMEKKPADTVSEVEVEEKKEAPEILQETETSMKETEKEVEKSEVEEEIETSELVQQEELEETELTGELVKAPEIESASVGEPEEIKTESDTELLIKKTGRPVVTAQALESAELLEVSTEEEITEETVTEISQPQDKNRFGEGAEESEMLSVVDEEAIFQALDVHSEEFGSEAKVKTAGIEPVKPEEKGQDEKIFSTAIDDDGELSWGVEVEETGKEAEPVTPISENLAAEKPGEATDVSFEEEVSQIDLPPVIKDEEIIEETQVVEEIGKPEVREEEVFISEEPQEEISVSNEELENEKEAPSLVSAAEEPVISDIPRLETGEEGQEIVFAQDIELEPIPEEKSEKPGEQKEIDSELGVKPQKDEKNEPEPDELTPVELTGIENIVIDDEEDIFIDIPEVPDFTEED